VGGQTGLGEWLKERCKVESLSLRQAAAKTGLSHATIGDIINGVSPSPESIQKLAHAFSGDGKERLALEDSLLILAGYRTQRPNGQDLSQPQAQLIDMVSQFDEPKIKLMARFAEFLSEMEKK